MPRPRCKPPARRSPAACFTLLLAWCLAASSASRADTPQVSAAQLREDISLIRDSLARAHPDLRFSTDPGAVAAALEATGRDAPPSMTRDQAWQRLATLNPLFADAHLFVGFPDWQADSLAYLKAGGAYFPFEVDIDGHGALFVRAALGGGATDLAGARIVEIDGVPAERLTTRLLARMHGDTPAFRAHLLATRWWLYHAKLSGTPPRYRLGLARGGRQWSVDLPASAQVPAVLRDAGDVDRAFRFDDAGAAGCAAVLKVGTFDGRFADRFAAFARAAFARLREDGASTLIVDIADNGGGDDALWIDGLMPYLATRPYRTGSAYRKKVMETNPAKGEVAGQVVDGQVDTWHASDLDNPLRFKGKVVVAIGPATYSSAVLFANVMHDFGFGTLAGSGDAARRTQSGGIRKFMLPNTGLALWVPRFILAPPSGGPRDALLAPALTLGQARAQACATPATATVPGAPR